MQRVCASAREKENKNSKKLQFFPRTFIDLNLWSVCTTTWIYWYGSENFLNKKSIFCSFYVFACWLSILIALLCARLNRNEEIDWGETRKIISHCIKYNFILCIHMDSEPCGWEMIRNQCNSFSGTDHTQHYTATQPYYSHTHAECVAFVRIHTYGDGFRCAPTRRLETQMINFL